MFRHLITAIPTLALIFMTGCSGNSGRGANPPCPDCNVFNGRPIPSTSTGQATAQSSETQILLPPLTSGNTVTITLPSAIAGAGAKINAALSTSTLSGLPATDSSHTSLLYEALSTSTSVTFNGNVNVAITDAGSAIPSSVYLAFYDGATWHYDVGNAAPPDMTFKTPWINEIFTPSATYGFAITTK